MKLREALKRYKGRIVRIGAAVAFFYIGRADEDAEAIIEDINDLYIKSHRAAITEARARISGSEKRIRDKVRTAKLVLEGKARVKDTKGEYIKLTPKSRAHYTKLANLTEEQILERAEEEKQRLRDKAQALEEYIRVTPRMLDREVVDNYEADPIYDGLARVLIIEGIESGKFWLRSEYESGKSEDDDE